MRHGFAFFRQLAPQFPALLRLAVKRLRHRRRAAHLADAQNLELKVAALLLHLQPVAGADLARGFGPQPITLDPAEFACPRRQRARLEESRGP